MGTSRRLRRSKAAPSQTAEQVGSFRCSTRCAPVGPATTAETLLTTVAGATPAPATRAGEFPPHVQIMKIVAEGPTDL